jgi:hypothetical protein
MNMHYTFWNETVEYELAVGMSYVAVADLSTFFNSIYTHSLPWALVGKTFAKANRGHALWFNDLDKKTRKLKDNETHGILIGPDTSNILSEIILVKVDNELYNKGYKFVRYIDDYKCFCQDKVTAEKFLEDLTFSIREYDLMLNYKKTKVVEIDEYLSINFVDEVTTMINAFPNCLNLNNLKAIINGLLSISKKYNDFSAMNYGLKMLKNHNMDYKTLINYINIVTQHTINHNYLVKIYEEVIMSRYSRAKTRVSKSVNKITEDAIKKYKYENISIMIYLAIKYSIDINIANVDLSYCMKSGNSILTLLVYKYKLLKGESVTDFINEAIKIHTSSIDMDNWWIFSYEVLDISDLSDYWKTLKANGVKFVNI